MSSTKEMIAQEQQHKEQNKYLDLLSVISMCAVVALHVNGCFWTYSTDRYWIEANIIECIMYFGVPVFFMISGATLLDYRERYSTKMFFIKRIKKTVIPFLFWSLFGILFLVYMDRLDVEAIDINYIVNGISNTSIVVIYWFFIPLFCVYLSMPLFAAIPKQDKKAIYGYIVVISIIFNLLFPLIVYFVPEVPYNKNMVIDIGGGYLLYILIGYLIHNVDIKRWYRVVIYILGLMGLLFHILGTYKLSMRDGFVNKTFKGYPTLHCVLYSVAIFVFIKYISTYLLKVNIINKIVDLIKKYTFGVYLLHWFVMTILIDVFDPNIYSLKYRLVMPFIVVVICIAIIELLRKVPVLKHMVP